MQLPSIDWSRGKFKHGRCATIGWGDSVFLWITVITLGCAFLGLALLFATRALAAVRQEWGTYLIKLMMVSCATMVLRCLFLAMVVADDGFDHWQNPGNNLGPQNKNSRLPARCSWRIHGCT